MKNKIAAIALIGASSLFGSTENSTQINGPNNELIQVTVALNEEEPNQQESKCGWLNFCIPQTVSKNKELAKMATEDWSKNNALKRIFTTNLAQMGFLTSLPTRALLSDTLQGGIEKKLYGPVNKLSDGLKKRSDFMNLTAVLLPFIIYIPTHLALRFKNMGRFKFLKTIKYFVLIFFNILSIFLTSMLISWPVKLFTDKAWIRTLVYLLIAFIHITVQLVTVSKLAAKKDQKTGEKNEKKETYNGFQGFWKSLSDGTRDLLNKPETAQKTKKQVRTASEKVICAFVIPVATYFGLILVTFVHLLTTNRMKP